jgi:hypothetical protein
LNPSDIASKATISARHSHLSKGAVAGIITCSVVLFLLLLYGYVFCIRRSCRIFRRRSRDVHEAVTPYPVHISPRPSSLSKGLSTSPKPSLAIASTPDLSALASPHSPPSPLLAPVHEADLATIVSRIVREQLRSQAPPQYEPVEAVLGR